MLKINNKYLAYATTCFLKSLGILSFNDETNKTLPYIVYKFILSEIKSLFLNKDFKFNAFYIQLNIILYTIGRNFRLLGGILWGKHL